MPEELSVVFQKLSILNQFTMDVEQVKQCIDAAVSAALRGQRTMIDVQNALLKDQIKNLTSRLGALEAPSLQVEAYEEIQITDSSGSESLDAAKSLPEFDGNRERYVSWRAAANAAHKIYEGSAGTARYYQAVLIMRNKVVGPANAVLSSFNTVLNFKAIIARLDFTYSDKRPVYLIEQELSTLRQGDLSISEFYDEVEKRVAMLVNKTIMTHGDNHDLTVNLNTKYRQDGLRVFISGLKKPLCDILFSSRPNDMASALALAQEVDANHQRYLFATSFAKKNEPRGENNPHYKIPNKGQNANSGRRGPEPMDIDPSSSKFKFNNGQNYRQGQNIPRRENSNQGYYNQSRLGGNNTNQVRAEKRPAESGRIDTNQKWQRLWHIKQDVLDEHEDSEDFQEPQEQVYDDLANEVDEDVNELNFLEVGPCCLGYRE